MSACEPAGPGNGGHPLFPTTRWSVVARAGGAPGPERRSALDELLRIYLPALRAHLRGAGLAPDDAEDVLQGFVEEKVLARDLMARADPERGRLRALLVTSLSRYRISCARSRRRRAEREVRLESSCVAAPGLTAGEPRAGAFLEVAWARALLRHALDRMEAECRSRGRSPVWELFHLRLVGPLLEGAEPSPYGELVARFGFASPGQAMNALVTAKRTFHRVLRECIGEYVEPAAVEQEVGDLLQALKRAGASGEPQAEGEDDARA